jgi:hypothetical protein
MASGTEAVQLGCGREENDGNGLHTEVAAAMLDGACPLHAHQNGGCVGGPDNEGFRARNALQAKMGTIEQPLAPNRLRCLDARRDRSDVSLLYVDRLQGLIDLQRPRTVKLGIIVIPVVQPECDVSVLLHFEHDNPIAQRVNGSGLNEHALARHWTEAGKAIIHRLQRQRSQFLVRHSGLQPGIDTRRRLRLEHDPAFGFSALALRDKIAMSVGWVDLDRQHRRNIEDLAAMEIVGSAGQAFRADRQATIRLVGRWFAP